MEISSISTAATAAQSQARPVKNEQEDDSTTVNKAADEGSSDAAVVSLSADAKGPAAADQSAAPAPSSPSSEAVNVEA